jgi:hypothetical protein
LIIIEYLAMSLPSETKQFIKIELPNRNPLTSRLQEWGADWKIDGVSAEKDWRYDAFVDFLSYSPSYQMTCLFHYGRCSLLDLPADRDRLIEVYCSATITLSGLTTTILTG